MISVPAAVDYGMPVDNTLPVDNAIPLYGVLGGGTATFDGGKYIWLEVPEDSAPDAFVGGEVATELSFSPINDRACAQDASIQLVEEHEPKVSELS
jgi:hypothetical protein